MSSERAEKLYKAYTLCSDLFQIHPEAIDKLLINLQDMKYYYTTKEETQKSIDQEYVVFEELVETNNG